MDIELPSREYVGELLAPSCVGFKELNYPVTYQLIELKMQVDRVSCRRIQSFETHRAEPTAARLFILTIHGRNIGVNTDAGKTPDVNVFRRMNFKDFCLACFSKTESSRRAQQTTFPLSNQ